MNGIKQFSRLTIFVAEPLWLTGLTDWRGLWLAKISSAFKWKLRSEAQFYFFLFRKSQKSFAVLLGGVI
jgi:hypothetical protein